MSNESLRVTITINRPGLESIYDAIAEADPGRGRAEVLRSILGAYELISTGRLAIGGGAASSPASRVAPKQNDKPTDKRGRPKKEPGAVLSVPAPAQSPQPSHAYQTPESMRPAPTTAMVVPAQDQEASPIDDAAMDELRDMLKGLAD